MYRRNLLRKRRSRRATVLIQAVVFGGLVGVGVAALAVDTGLMYGAKQELQSAADAAALAAASRLGSDPDAESKAIAEGSLFASLNSVMGDSADLLSTDIVFGHADLVNGKYVFLAGQQPKDAVRVTLKRDASAADGPVSLLFAKMFGMDGARLQASATAMLVPRDIALVVDLSGSMNDDSELRHYAEFASEKSGTIDGVQINLQSIWSHLPVNTGKAGIKNGSNPTSPGAPAAGDNQPGTGSGKPQSASGDAPNSGDDVGPRWGWMTKFGNEIVHGSYNPTTDPGLYYIPYNATCSDADVVANLTEAGYSSAERTALLSGQYDKDNYANRVLVLLGLAGWKSGKSGGKYTSGGDGDNIVEGGELTSSVGYPYNSGSWSDYVSYMRSTSTFMYDTDSNLRYRFGIKTFVNYLLESRESNAETPQLANTPEEPLNSVKDAVQVLIDELVALESNDHLSLETFDHYGKHRMNLTVPSAGDDLSDLLQAIADNVRTYQAGHDASYTNIGGGMQKAIQELESNRARGAAKKYIIMLTDGKPNVNSSNTYVGNNHSSALSWAQDRADYAKDNGVTIFTVGVGGDVDEDLLQDMASGETFYFYADNAPDPDNGGLPKYVNQLKQIFKELGGRRPIRLIQ